VLQAFRPLGPGGSRRPDVEAWRDCSCIELFTGPGHIIDSVSVGNVDTNGFLHSLPLRGNIILQSHLLFSLHCAVTAKLEGTIVIHFCGVVLFLSVSLPSRIYCRGYLTHLDSLATYCTHTNIKATTYTPLHVWCPCRMIHTITYHSYLAVL